MGLLDRFIKKSKEQEQKPEQDSKPFAIGETKTDGIYQFTYTSDPITERCGYRGEDEKIVGYNYGWQIKCIDTQTPMQDVVMPDTFMGQPVIKANECFEGCYNVATVKHISSEALELGKISDMFKNSGLREVPEQLNSYQIHWACKEAYALANTEQLKNLSWEYEKAKRDVEYANRNVRTYSGYKDRDVSLVGDEFSPYVKFEKVSFVYEYNPVSVIRVQDTDGKWFAINPNGPKLGHEYNSSADRTPYNSSFVPYESYMSRFDSTKIHGLTVESFVEVSPEVGKDAIAASYDVAIGKLEKYAEKLQEHLDEISTSLDKVIAEETAKADAAQEGLNFTPRKSEPEIDTPNLDENDDHDTI